MSDLTAAVHAAAKAIAKSEGWSYEYAFPDRQRACAKTARVVVAAARPHIAEEIAAKIETRIRNWPGMGFHVIDRNEAFAQAAGDARAIGEGGSDADR